MEHDALDQDSRAALERRALGNVRALAGALDYNDKLDRKGGRRFLVAAVVGAVVVVGGLAISAAVTAPPPDALEMTRCTLAGRIEASRAYTAELERLYPEMRPTEKNKLVGGRLEEFVARARAACAAKLRKAA